MWQLLNEAEVLPYEGAVCPPGNAPADTLKAWAADVSGLIKSIDANHLVSLGTLGGGQCGAQGVQYQDVHDIATIDVCEYHDYGSALSPMPGDQWNGLQARIDQCTQLGKPIFVGETGIVPADTDGTLSGRAAALTAKLDAQFAAGVSGIVAWAWSNLGSTLDNYDIGAGDPLIQALALGPEEDTDGDGCGDVEESDSNPAQLGGQRNPLNPWDFYDVNISKRVDATDIAIVRSKFNTKTGDPGYGTAFDRSAGAHPWAPGPPNGKIDAIDIALVRAEFNHSCQAAP